MRPDPRRRTHGRKDVREGASLRPVRVTASCPGPLRRSDCSTRRRRIPACIEATSGSPGLRVDARRGPVPPSELEPRHWQELQHTVERRVLRYFRRHDLLDQSATTNMITWQARVAPASTLRPVSIAATATGSSGSSATVPGRPSHFIASTPSGGMRLSRRRMPGCSTGYSAGQHPRDQPDTCTQTHQERDHVVA